MRTNLGSKQPRTHSFALEVKSLRFDRWNDVGIWIDAMNAKSAERKLRRLNGPPAYFMRTREWRLVDKGRTPRALFTLSIPLTL